MRLTVYFDGQFWCGLIERFDDGILSADRHIFGAEPKDGEIEDFVNHHLVKIIKNTASGIGSNLPEIKKINPKRLKKLAALEMKSVSVSTKAQEALQQQLEANKKEKQRIAKDRLEELKEYKRAIAVEKRKKKHRGH